MTTRPGHGTVDRQARRSRREDLIAVSCAIATENRNKSAGLCPRRPVPCITRIVCPGNGSLTMIAKSFRTYGRVCYLVGHLGRAAVAPMPRLYRFTPLMRLPLRQRRRARPGAMAHNPNLAGAVGHSPRTVRLIPRREHAERGKST